MTQSNRQARRAWAAAQRKHIKRGGVYHVEFAHDSDCMIYTSARLCSCDPVRTLCDDAGRVLARVEGAGEYDPLELMGAAQ